MMTHQEKRKLLDSKGSAKILWYATIAALGLLLVQEIRASVDVLLVWGLSEASPDNAVFAAVLFFVNAFIFIVPVLTVVALWGVLRFARWAMIVLILQGGFIFFGLGITSDYQSLISSVVPILVIALILWSYWRVVRIVHPKIGTPTAENPAP